MIVAQTLLSAAARLFSPGPGDRPRDADKSVGAADKSVCATSFLLLALTLHAQTASDLIKQGEQIFNKSCATGYCHATKGGTGGGAPRLAARGFDETYINSVTARGVPGTSMPPFAGTLPRPELTAVVAYVSSLNGIANPNLNFGPPGARGGAPADTLSPQAARGRALFTEAVRGFGRCSTCHEINGLGIPVATPISTVPVDVAALRALVTPQVSTVTVESEAMAALVVSKSGRTVVFDDLTGPPPVLRSVEPASAKIAEGSGWRHSSVIGSYNDADLESILAYLRLVVRSQ